MRKIYTVDCETDPFLYGRVPAPFVWGVYHRTKNGVVEYHKFYDTKGFIEFITQEECVAYAHNGGKFDWHFILKYIVPFQDVTIINGRLSKFQIGLCEFRDSYNILPVPLAAFKKDEFDYTKMEQDVRHLHMQEIEEYLKNDCEYLFDLVERFISDYGLNLTLAGAALKTWGKISKTKPPKTSKEYYDSLSKYYYGGRVECFKAGIIETPFKVVDINSAYPWAMKQPHPYGQYPILDDELPECKEKIKQCFITLSAVSYGGLPHREKDGSLSFPSDDVERIYNITGHEYLAAIDTRTIKSIKIIKVVSFTESIQFDEYIDHFYAMKSECKDKDDAGYLLAKLFLNSLYGKYGSNPEKYDTFMFINPSHIEAAEQDGFEYAGEVGRWAIVARDLSDEESRYYDIAVAASITGCVRAKMWRSICECEDVIYCDTDSIAAGNIDKLELHKTNLGAWDVEAVCDRGAVAGKKLYAFHDSKTKKWKTASKGARLSHDEILRVAAGERVEYKNMAPTFSTKKNPTFVKRTIAKNV